MNRTLFLDGNSLTLENVEQVARAGVKAKLHKSSLPRIKKSAKRVEELVRERKKVYGITTGFGSHAGIFIADQRSAEILQENIIQSHLVSVGEPFSDDVSRGILLIRANALAKGFSGVRPQLVSRILEILNRSITPLIPQKGSVGASGDLSPLAYASLPVLGLGEVKYKGKIMGAKIALKRARLKPEFKLSYKEGLGLTNGTAVMGALAALSCRDAERLVKCADLAAALSLEAVCGKIDAFDQRLHRLRPLTGQMASARNIRRLTSGSTLLDKASQVQDSYSIRCVPQVHGASWDALQYVKSVVEIEINSATDNPLILENGKVCSGGNFHGQPLALACDFLGMALAELGSISERRIQKLLDSNHNSGLPSNLIPQAGLNTGLMIVQYTAAALVSENKVLAHPASVDSIPTSANIEDHVSMGTIAARKAKEILENVQSAIAIELLCACQALEFRKGTLPPTLRANPDSHIRGKPGKGTLAAYQFIRKKVSPVKSDRRLDQDINTLRELVISGELVRVVEARVGPLYKSK